MNTIYYVIYKGTTFHFSDRGPMKRFLYTTGINVKHNRSFVTETSGNKHKAITYTEK